MARNEFTRTIVKTTISPATVKLLEGKVVTEKLAPITVNGKVDEDKAVDLAKKQYGKKQQYVVTVSHEEETYAISIEDFMKYAHKVEPKTEQAENKAE